MRNLVKGCLIIAIFACASPSHESRLTRLRTGEIERLVNGHYVHYAPDPEIRITGQEDGRRESYCNGKMSGPAHRVNRIFAPYTIQDNQLCVDYSSANKMCRSFYRDATGQLYSQFGDQEPAPIRTGPLSEGACRSS